MDRLTIDATKAQEIAHFRAFLGTLEKGTYLASMLQGAADLAEEWISQDVSFELLPALRRMQWDLRESIAEKTAERKKIGEDIEQMKRERLSILRDVANARDELRKADEAQQTAQRMKDRAYQRAVSFVAENANR